MHLISAKKQLLFVEIIGIGAVDTDAVCHVTGDDPREVDLYKSTCPKGAASFFLANACNSPFFGFDRGFKGRREKPRAKNRLPRL